jgi:hypothetical protein
VPAHAAGERRDTIERQRALAALRASFDVNPLTLVVAPGGSGKTTALAAVAPLELRWDVDPRGLLAGVDADPSRRRLAGLRAGDDPGHRLHARLPQDAPATAAR